MGKKGVMLDNGKNAQSSMALYWKKHQQQSKKPKKQYQPTQQQQLDQRVQSGFQKWKLHKQKMISKNFQKKQKPTHHQKADGNTAKNQQNEEQEEAEIIYEKQKEKKLDIRIPGFKSKDALKSKLKPEYNKQVSQADNILKLPSHMQGITQEDIVRILREKKAQAQMAKRKRVVEAQEDVMLGENFLDSFKIKPEQNEKKTEQKVEQKIDEEKPEQSFFKSDILNQISKGNTSVILKPQPAEEPNHTEQMTQKQKVIVEVAQPSPQKPQPSQVQAQPRRHLFKPRVLNNLK